MTTRSLYEAYHIPPNLTRHMLRVTSLAAAIIESWIGPPIRGDIILCACLLHDAGKLVVFDLSQPELFEEEAVNIDKWRKIQTAMRLKYGTNEHHATNNVIREMGVNNTIADLVDKIDWPKIHGFLDTKDFEPLIGIYSDMRIGPFGILTLEERVSNLKKRMKISGDSLDGIARAATEAERLISSHVSCDLRTITESNITSRFTMLLDSDIPSRAY